MSPLTGLGIFWNRFLQRFRTYGAGGIRLRQRLRRDRGGLIFDFCKSFKMPMFLRFPPDFGLGYKI
jgi:hypothetical protein